MASKDKKLIKLYESDLGEDFNQKLVPFSITSKLDDCVKYDDRVGNCGCPVPFEMRHLVATFDPETSKDKKCLVVKFPVPNIVSIADYVDKLRKCGAVCIDYVGESWKVIPSSYKGKILYVPNYDLIKLNDAGKFSPKVSGRMKEYGSDIAGQYQPKVAIEADPIDLATIILGAAPVKNPDSGLYEITGNESGCTGKLVKQDVCSLSELTARYITLRGNSTYDGISEAQKKIPKIFNRKIPTKNAGDWTLSCIKKISDGFKGIHCFGYQGESITRIDLLI